MSSATPRRGGYDHDRAACNAGDALSTTTQCTPTGSSGSTAFSRADTTTWGLLSLGTTARSKKAPCNVRVVSTDVFGLRGPAVSRQGSRASPRRVGGHPWRSSWCRPRSARGSRPLTEGRRTVRTSTPRRRDCGRCNPPRATSSSGAPGANDLAGSLAFGCRTANGSSSCRVHATSRLHRVSEEDVGDAAVSRPGGQPRHRSGCLCTRTSDRTP